jgi:hypothetical protein
MNRLFIIGNGFDLAHGLKTKYSDFINDFWKNLELKTRDDLIYLNPQRKMKPLNNEKITNYYSFMTELLESADIPNLEVDRYKDMIKVSGYRTVDLFRFNNEFFKTITLKNGIENWVDIEREYYYQLKKIVKTEREPKESDDSFNSRIREQVLKLNSEFEQIKDLFEQYLKEKIEPCISKNLIKEEIITLFDVVEYKKGQALNNYLEEFPKEDHELLLKENELLKDLYYYNIEEKIINGELGNKTIFLNFNYTRLINEYINCYRHDLYNQIQIHGKIGDKNNKINFGFGDEMDEDYKMIENLDENEFLRNFKSFGYLQNSNYKNLLDFIELGKFQVIIMGHSCGISDRTMLNTIFEHPNCRSIKPFYYQWKDEEGITHDNFTELVQNISRHFNKKKQMREKVINKSLCQPLPQFKKE